MTEYKKIDISTSEWKVMQILWDKSPQTLGEISKQLEDKVSWNKTTINTLLRRLVKKQAVSFHEARFFKYYPIVTESECLKEEMKEILDRLFYSSPKKMMVALVENENFNDEDLSEIERMLKDIRNRGNNND
jgi:BlaI family penicillinase repressor